MSIDCKPFRAGSVLLAAWLQAMAASAVTINVNSTADVLANDGVCTLREAVIAANTDFPSGPAFGECPAGSGADLIVLTVNGTYSFAIPGTGENAALTGDLDLTEEVEIRGTSPTLQVINGQLLDRVFWVASSVSATFNNVTITGGNAGSFNDGGAIYNDGTVTVVDSVLNGNSAGGEGGGIYVSGSGGATLTRTTVKSNHASDGGGMYGSFGSITVIDSIFDSNTASDDGGGIFSFEPVSIVSSVFSGNTANDLGGGIALGDDTTITDSTFTMNGAAFGAALFAFDPLTVKNTTFSSNTATSSGGAIYHDCCSTTSLQNVTFSEGGALASSAVFHDGGTVTAANTLIDGRCDGDSLSSNGGNIESPGNTCDLLGATDQSGVAASALNLLPLDENGGPGPTHLPGPSSVAIEGGVIGFCLPADQRGVTRPADFDGVGGAECDVGAVELSPCPHSTTLLLQNDTVMGMESFAACEQIQTGSAFVIDSSAVATFQAGERIAIGNGLTVEAGADVEFETRWAFWESIP